MTELQLYKFIYGHDIEFHIYKNGMHQEDCSEFDYDNNKWEILIFIPFCHLNGFCQLDSGMFSEEPLDAKLCNNYVGIDLVPIMESYGINPANIFSND